MDAQDLTDSVLALSGGTDQVKVLTEDGVVYNIEVVEKDSEGDIVWLKVVEEDE